ncbi:MAG: helix-turn-helix transcriptional regulator [Clostridiales bacterium]|nr:helix-turn-helix transcriptional regulator [Clostridiales bacterium]
MAVSYKRLQHLMIEKNISNAELMRRANIITKIKTGKYIALDKVESICRAMDFTPNDMMEFIYSNEGADSNE